MRSVCVGACVCFVCMCVHTQAAHKVLARVGGVEVLSFSKERVPEIQCNHLWEVVSAYRVVLIIIKKFLMDNVRLLQFIILCQIVIVFKF